MWSYLWQNFLIDPKAKNIIAEKIINLYWELGCTTLFEIWPWKWAITKKICNISDNFFVIEKDEKMVKLLEEKIYTNEKLKTWLVLENIINTDVLDFDFQQIITEKKLNPNQTLIVGNLPYYITSPILRKFFGYGKQEFVGWVFLIQNEVAEKIITKAKKKSYLRRLLNQKYDVKYLKWIPPRAFKPAPKVKSAVIQLTKNNKNLQIEFDDLQNFLDIFAPFSRKTLWKIQKMQEKKQIRQIPNIPDFLKKKRLEELEWKEMEEILRNK